MSTPRVPTDVLLHIIQFADVVTLGNFRLLNKATLHLIDSYEAWISKAVAREHGWDVRYQHLGPPFTTFKDLRELDCMDLAHEVVLYLCCHSQSYPLCPLRHIFLPPWSYALCSRLEDGVRVLKNLDRMRSEQRMPRLLRHVTDKHKTSTYEEECMSYMRDLTGTSFFNFVLLLLLLRYTITNSSVRCATCQSFCVLHSERCLSLPEPPSSDADQLHGRPTKASLFGSGRMAISGVTAKEMAKIVSKLPKRLAITEATIQSAWQSILCLPPLSDFNVNGTDQVCAFFAELQKCKQNWCPDRWVTGRSFWSYQLFFDRSWKDFYMKDGIRTRLLRKIRTVSPVSQPSQRTRGPRNLWA